MAISLNGAMRRTLLAASRSPGISRWVHRYGRFAAYRFVAGETLDDCVQVLRRLNAAGFKTNTTLLGEGVRDVVTAASITAAYRHILDRLASEKLRTNLSVKLTHLGLDVREDVAAENLTALVAHAGHLSNFVRVDMEESARVDATLRIYRRLREAGHDNVGTVLQAYLYRTEEDLRSLLPVRPNLRLVKGAYLEPPAVAFPRKADVDRNYVHLMELMLQGGGYTAIATHDDRIIAHAIECVGRYGVARERFEFQMLYGVRPGLQQDLVRQGYTVLVATPFGAEWFPYFMRRLAERPANVLFILRNLLRS
jgi:proline dehydrogenase